MISASSLEKTLRRKGTILKTADIRAEYENYIPKRGGRTSNAEREEWGTVGRQATGMAKRRSSGTIKKTPKGKG